MDGPSSSSKKRAAPAQDAAVAEDIGDRVGDRVQIASMEYWLDSLALSILSNHEPDAGLLERDDDAVLQRSKADHPLITLAIASSFSFRRRKGSMEYEAALFLQLYVSKVKPSVQDLLVLTEAKVKKVPTSTLPDADGPTTTTTVSQTNMGSKFITSQWVASVQEIGVSVKAYARVAPSLGASMYSMRLEDEPLCDVVLVVDGAELHAHKAALAVESPVFRAMFGKNFKEGRESRVEVEGVSRELFEKFLKFLYTKEIADEEDQDGVVGLLGLADLYMVDSLKVECERLLMAVKKERVISLLQEAVNKPFISSAVRCKAAEIVAANWEYVESSKEWGMFKGKYPIFADLVKGASRQKQPVRQRSQ